MMEFRCRLMTPAGEITERTISAETEGHVRRQLEGAGILVLSIKQRGGVAALLATGIGRRRVPRHDLMVFNQELATLLRAGMTVVQSLDLLKGQQLHPTLRTALLVVSDRVRAGAALSEAMREQGSLFPPVYTASLVAGERSGSLDDVLRRYVAYEKLLHTVRRRTLSALLYPAFLVLLSIGLMCLIVLQVVPAFSDFYGGFGAELPASTQAIMTASQFVTDHLGLLLVGAVALAGITGLWLRTADHRRRLDAVVLRLPFVGRNVEKFITAQLTRTLAILLRGGIPLVTALDVAARSLGNRHVTDRLLGAIEQVKAGESLTASVRAAGVMPDAALKMVEVGESTGALQEMLENVAGFYDEEVDTEVGRFVTLIEPTILVVMGLVIALLVLALYVPLFQLSSAVA